MGFLDNVKKKQQETNAAINPLAKGATSSTKVNPFAKKVVEPEPKEEEKVEEVKETVKTPQEPEVLIEKDEEKTAESVESKSEPEPVPEKEKVEESTEVTSSEENIVPEVKEKKPITKRRTRKKVEPNTDTEEETMEEPSVPKPIPHCEEMDYNKLEQALRVPFRDEKWEERKDYINEKLNAIQLTDMNPATIMQALADLNELRDEIRSEATNAQTLYESLSSKEPEGLIERTKKTNLGLGTNDLQRKQSGIEACYVYKVTVADGDDSKEIGINLFELLDETRERHNFYTSIMRSIAFKLNCLTTQNFSLKIDKDLAPMS